MRPFCYAAWALLAALAITLGEPLIKLSQWAVEHSDLYAPPPCPHVRRVPSALWLFGVCADCGEPLQRCPSCQGSIRETKGMVCQTCGMDYFR